MLQHGYLVSFHHFPPVSQDPREFPSCTPGSVQVLALKEEISKMLQKVALESVDQPALGFCSRLFLAEKATGGWRPVIDLSVLIGFVTLTKFQMETVVSVLGSIRQDDWTFSIKLKDSYFQIPIRLDSHLYLRFVQKGQVFQFRALGFSLSIAPQVFTKVFSLMMEWAHRLGVRLLRCQDDWLVVAKSLPFLLLQLCRDLGML